MASCVFLFVCWVVCLHEQAYKAGFVLTNREDFVGGMARLWLLVDWDIHIHSPRPVAIMDCAPGVLTTMRRKIVRRMGLTHYGVDGEPCPVVSTLARERGKNLCWVSIWGKQSESGPLAGPQWPTQSAGSGIQAGLVPICYLLEKQELLSRSKFAFI